MNKKEIGEIKRQFKMNNDKMTIDGVATILIRDKEVVDTSYMKMSMNDSDNERPEESIYMGALDSKEYLDILKKTLSGQFGKGCREYAVNSGDSEALKQLTSIKDSGVFNNGSATLLAESIIPVVDEYEYAVVIASCTYEVPAKGGDEVDKEFADGEIFQFCVTSICPITNTIFGLKCNKSNNRIGCDSDAVKMVGMPIAGMMYPVFNNRSSDIHSVLVYAKKHKEPNIRLVEDVLGCTYVLSPEEEKQRFNLLVRKMSQADKSAVISGAKYSLVKDVYERIMNLVKATEEDSDIAVLNKDMVKKVFLACNADDDAMEKFDDIYDEVIEGHELTAVNIINTSKLDIKNADIVLNVKPGKTDKVISKNIEGKKCLVVEIEDGVEINGIDVDL